jgi:hypothetical protein
VSILRHIHWSAHDIIFTYSDRSVPWKTRHPIETEAPIKSVEVNIEIRTLLIHNLCKLCLLTCLIGCYARWISLSFMPLVVFYCVGFSVIRGSQSEHVIFMLILQIFWFNAVSAQLIQKSCRRPLSNNIDLSKRQSLMIYWLPCAQMMC